MSGCDFDALESLAFDELTPTLADEARAHVATCPACAAELGLLRAERGAFAERARASAPLPGFSAALARSRWSGPVPGEPQAAPNPGPRVPSGTSRWSRQRPLRRPRVRAFPGPSRRSGSRRRRRSPASFSCPRRTRRGSIRRPRRRSWPSPRPRTSVATRRFSTGSPPRRRPPPCARCRSTAALRRRRRAIRERVDRAGRARRRRRVESTPALTILL